MTTTTDVINPEEKAADITYEEISSDSEHLEDDQDSDYDVILCPDSSDMCI